MSIDLPKRKLRSTTGRNTTWGVFKAYAVSFLFRPGGVYRCLPLDSQFVSMNLKCISVFLKVPPIQSKTMYLQDADSTSDSLDLGASPDLGNSPDKPPRPKREALQEIHHFRQKLSSIKDLPKGALFITTYKHGCGF